MLSLNNIGLTLFQRRPFSGISLTVLPGAIIHIKGKNGAGKTSLLRMMAGVQQPSVGNITFGKQQVTSIDMQKPYCNYIGHSLALKQELTVVENIAFWAKLYGGEMLVASALRYWQLGDIIDTRLGELSRGNQKKVALARLLACPAEIWLLDEVDTSLDEQNLARLNNLIMSKANNGGIILYSSHNKSPFKDIININIDDYSEEKTRAYRG